MEDTKSRRQVVLRSEAQGVSGLLVQWLAGHNPLDLYFLIKLSENFIRLFLEIIVRETHSLLSGKESLTTVRGNFIPINVRLAPRPLPTAIYPPDHTSHKGQVPPGSTH
jgi:hypothetical protein